MDDSEQWATPSFLLRKTPDRPIAQSPKTSGGRNPPSTGHAHHKEQAATKPRSPQVRFRAVMWTSAQRGRSRKFRAILSYRPPAEVWDAESAQYSEHRNRGGADGPRSLPA